MKPEYIVTAAIACVGLAAVLAPSIYAQSESSVYTSRDCTEFVGTFRDTCTAAQLSRIEKLMTEHLNER